jgi:hypothetical protein
MVFFEYCPIHYLWKKKWQESGKKRGGQKNQVLKSFSIGAYDSEGQVTRLKPHDLNVFNSILQLIIFKSFQSIKS